VKRYYPLSVFRCSLKQPIQNLAASFKTARKNLKILAKAEVSLYATETFLIGRSALSVFVYRENSKSPVKKCRTKKRCRIDAKTSALVIGNH